MTALRCHHNFCPPGMLDDMLAGIRTTVRHPDWDRVLTGIGPEAVELWQG